MILPLIFGAPNGCASSTYGGMGGAQDQGSPKRDYGYIGDILGIYWENGKEDGNYYSGVMV